MILKTWIKQPDEITDYDILYAPWLSSTNDSLNDVEISIECMDNPDDTELVLDSYAITETTVKFWLSGGTDGYKYKITILTNTVEQRTDESEVIIVIKDF